MKSKWIFSLLCFSLVSGCTALPKGSDGETVADETEAQSASSPSSAPTEMRVAFTELCPVTAAEKESAVGAIAVSIAANLGTRVIGGAIDTLSGYLTEDKASVYSTTSRMEGMFAFEGGKISINKDERCMVISVASKYGSLPDPDDNADQLKIMSDQSPSVNLAIYKAVGLIGKPDFYAEFRLRSNSDAGAKQMVFTYLPKFIYYPKFVSKATMLKKPERDVLLKIDFLEPGGAGAFGTIEVQWSGVKNGGITAESLRSRKLPWVALPESARNIEMPGGATRIPVFPVNVKAQLVETTKPHTLAKYIGEALKSEKETITNATKEAVNLAFSQDARISARNVAITEVEEKYKSYLDLYDLANEAYQKYAAHAPGDTVGKQKAALAVKIAYQKLANAEAALRRAYENSGIGAMNLLPALPAVI